MSNLPPRIVIPVLSTGQVLGDLRQYIERFVVPIHEPGYPQEQFIIIEIGVKWR